MSTYASMGEITLFGDFNAHANILDLDFVENDYEKDLENNYQIRILDIHHASA